MVIDYGQQIETLKELNVLHLFEIIKVIRQQLQLLPRIKDAQRAMAVAVGYQYLLVAFLMDYRDKVRWNFN